jgi:hypothetical protein
MVTPTGFARKENSKGGDMSVKRTLIALSAAALLAACASGGSKPGTTVAGATAPQGWRTPSSPIDLGDYKRGAATTVAQRYAAQIARRYPMDSPMPQAVADLKKNDFRCEAAPAAGRGDPPDQVCRRKVAEGECTHTWQTHLWDDAPGAAAKVTRVRGLYDRSCAADDGLLGGPG